MLWTMCWWGHGSAAQGRRWAGRQLGNGGLAHGKGGLTVSGLYLVEPGDNDALGQVGTGSAGVRAYLDGGAGSDGCVAKRVRVAEKRRDAEHVLAGRQARAHAGEGIAHVFDSRGPALGKLGPRSCAGVGELRAAGPDLRSAASHSARAAWAISRL